MRVFRQPFYSGRNVAPVAGAASRSWASKRFLFAPTIAVLSLRRFDPLGVNSCRSGSNSTSMGGHPNPTAGSSSSSLLNWASKRFISDPYKTLGVSPTASQDEIKVAYKKLVMQYHPDRNKSPGAEAKFKDISAAYSTLRDQSKRREYDTYHGGGTGGFGANRPGGTPGGGTGGFGPRPMYQNQNVNMSKDDADRMFREMFGSRDFNSIFKDFYASQNEPHPYGGNNPDQKVTRDEFMRDKFGNTYRVTTWETGGSSSSGSSSRSQASAAGYQNEPTHHHRHGRLFSEENNPFASAFGGRRGAADPFSSFFNQAGGFGGGQQSAWQSGFNQGQTASSGSSGGSTTGTHQQQQWPGAEEQQQQHQYQQYQQQQQQQGFGGQNPFYWTSTPHARNLNWQASPFRVFLWVFLLGIFFSAMLSFFLTHPGLTLCLLLMWMLFRRPPAARFH